MLKYSDSSTFLIVPSKLDSQLITPSIVSLKASSYSLHYPLNDHVIKYQYVSIYQNPTPLKIEYMRPPIDSIPPAAIESKNSANIK